jgi:RNA polymerase sigma factor (sigma-70 family)
MSLKESLKKIIGIAPKQIDYTKQSDEWLMGQWIKHLNNEAYEEIYHRYAKRVYEFLRIKTTTENAEDGVQYCFTLLIEKRESFNVNNLSLKNLFFTIAYNYAKRYDKVTQRNLSLEQEKEVGLDLVNEKFEMAGALLLKDYRKKIHVFLNELKSEQKLVLYLHIVEDYTPKEISGMLKIDTRKVSNIIYQGHKYVQNRFLDVLGDKND